MPSIDNTELSRAPDPNYKPSSGLYKIVNCGENASAIIDAFDTLHESLKLGMADSMESSRSGAYITFFKDFTYAGYMRRILMDAFTGIAVQPSVAGNPPASPQAVCVSSPGQLQILRGQSLVDMYIECTKRPSVHMYILTGGSLIVACPSFFNIPIAPAPGPSDCLPVNRFLNRFLGPGRQLIEYQIYVLLHEIAHYYIYAASQTRFDHYDVATCFHLGPLESSQNAQNYAFYVASKSSLVLGKALSRSSLRRAKLSSLI